MFETVRQVN